MHQLVKFISSLNDTINRQISLFVVSLIFLLSILLSVSVFYRYILNDSLYWSGEVSRYMLVYVVFLGSTMAHKHKAHIRIDMIFTYLSNTNKRNIEILIAVFFIFFWMLVLMGSIKLFPLFMMQTTATLGMPFAVAFAPLPLSSIIWIFYCCEDILTLMVKK